MLRILHFFFRLLTSICAFMLSYLLFAFNLHRKRRLSLRGSSAAPRCRPRLSLTPAVDISYDSPLTPLRLPLPPSTFISTSTSAFTRTSPSSLPTSFNSSLFAVEPAHSEDGFWIHSPSPSPSSSSSPSPSSPSPPPFHSTTSPPSPQASSSASVEAVQAAATATAYQQHEGDSDDYPSPSSASPSLFPYPCPSSSPSPLPPILPTSAAAAATAASPTISLSAWLKTSSLPGYLHRFRNYTPHATHIFIKRVGVFIQEMHFCTQGEDFQLHPAIEYSDFIDGFLQRPMDPLAAYLSYHKEDLKPSTILSRLDDISTFATWFCLHHLVQPSLLLPLKDCLITLRRTYRRKNKALRSQRTMESEVIMHRIA